MKINISVDLEDLLGSYSNDLEDLLKMEIKSEVTKELKKSKEYKDYIKDQTNKLLNSLKGA